MRKRQHKKLVHKGQYVAEVEIGLLDTDRLIILNISLLIIVFSL